MNWLFLSFIDLILVTFIALLYKYIGNEFTNDVNLYLKSTMLIFIIAGLVGLIGFLYLYYFPLKTISSANIDNEITTDIQLPIFSIIITGILMICAHSLHLIVYNISPNTGYPLSILSISTIFVTLLSVFLFNSPISWAAFIGIVLSIIGVSIVCIFR